MGSDVETVEVVETPVVPAPKKRGGNRKPFNPYKKIAAIEAAKEATKLRELASKIRKRVDPKDITPSTVVNMILDIYDEARTAQRYADALEATKQLGEYLDIFKSKPTSVNQILNITDSASFDKDLSRFARAAGITLQLEDKTTDVKFEEVPVSNKGGGSVGGGGSVPGDGERDVWVTGSEALPPR